eukprot:12893165-Prorocentrum_lima.AAC.1
MMIKGRKPEGRISVESTLASENVPATHTWVKGHVKGRIALFADIMIQTGAKASNVEFLKALEKNWTMSKPRHLGPG